MGALCYRGSGGGSHAGATTNAAGYGGFGGCGLAPANGPYHPALSGHGPGNPLFPTSFAGLSVGPVGKCSQGLLFNVKLAWLALSIFAFQKRAIRWSRKQSVDSSLTRSLAPPKPKR